MENKEKDFYELNKEKIEKLIKQLGSKYLCHPKNRITKLKYKRTIKSFNKKIHRF